MLWFADTTLRGILLKKSANKSIISGAESYDRRRQKLFFCFEMYEDRTSKLGLVDCSEPSVIDFGQGCVAGMPSREAKLKRTKKVAVFDNLVRCLWIWFSRRLVKKKREEILI